MPLIFPLDDSIVVRLASIKITLEVCTLALESPPHRPSTNYRLMQQTQQQIHVTISYSCTWVRKLYRPKHIPVTQHYYYYFFFNKHKTVK